MFVSYLMVDQLVLKNIKEEILELEVQKESILIENSEIDLNSEEEKSKDIVVDLESKLSQLVSIEYIQKLPNENGEVDSNSLLEIKVRGAIENILAMDEILKDYTLEKIDVEKMLMSEVINEESDEEKPQEVIQLFDCVMTIHVG